MDPEFFTRFLVKAEGHKSPKSDSQDPHEREARWKRLHHSGSPLPFKVDGRELGRHWASVRFMSESADKKDDGDAEEKADEKEEETDDKEGGDEEKDDKAEEDEEEEEEKPEKEEPKSDAKESKAEDTEDDGEGGGDEEDLVDPMDTLKGKCQENLCAQFKERLDECNNRVSSCNGQTEETCVEEVMDFVYCIDKCVAKDLFKYLK
jgi:ubiquinol-cytochrome c reductase subunit 6